MKSAKRKHDSYDIHFCDELWCEFLERRIMLSTVEVIAAGTTGDEAIDLQINGQVVASYDNLGSGARSRVFQSNEYNTAATISPDDVRIRFTNDLYDPVNGIDRNVRVDAVVIDGVRYETENPTVYSTGTWLAEDGVQPGFRQSEYLHTAGYFQYASPPTNEGSVIEIRARGTEGIEELELQIGGQSVAQFSASVDFQVFQYQAASSNVSADDVRIQFLNDQYDPANGIDTNLTVDYIAIDGNVYQTEAPSVYSTGTWRAEDGIQPGFRRSETLHGNGYFQYAESSATGSEIIVNARGAEGGERFQLQIDGFVASEYSVATNQQAFTYRASETVTADQIRIAFINDQRDPANGIDFNLIVDNVIVDGVTFETEAPNVYSTGTWRAGVGTEPGYPQSEVLHSNGYFQYATTSTNPGTIGLTTDAVTFDEDIGQVGVAVFRTGGSDGRVTVDYTTVIGTANESDFQPISGTLVFEDGVSDRLLSISIVDDTVDEPNESFELRLSNPTGGAGLGRTTEQLTIVDNDEVAPPSPGTIGIAVDTMTFREDVGQVEVVVSRSGGSDGRVTVNYATVTGTAGSNDFQPISGTLVFEDGVTEQSLSVSIVDDDNSELDESFEVRLSNPTGGAELGRSTGQLTIADNDEAVTGYLPDMVVIASTLGERLSIDRNEQPGRDLLRFSTEVANAGTGPLELWGGDTSGSSQDVYQRIYQPNGNFEDVLAGEFVFHPSHGHIHFEGFAEYDLVNDQGQVVASGGKTSFCLVNIRQPFPSISADADRVHGRGGNSCGQIQGISTGYSDVYSASLPDQWIDVTNVADGDYWLEVTADPDNSLIESDESNNSDRIRIRLSNGTVRVL